MKTWSLCRQFRAYGLGYAKQPRFLPPRDLGSFQIRANSSSGSSFVVTNNVIRFLDDFGIIRYGQPIPRSGVSDDAVVFPYRAKSSTSSSSDLARDRNVEFAYLLEDTDEGALKRFSFLQLLSFLKLPKLMPFSWRRPGQGSRRKLCRSLQRRFRRLQSFDGLA